MSNKTLVRGPRHSEGPSDWYLGRWYRTQYARENTWFLPLFVEQSADKSWAEDHVVGVGVYALSGDIYAHTYSHEVLRSRAIRTQSYVYVGQRLHGRSRWLGTFRPLRMPPPRVIVVVTERANRRCFRHEDCIKTQVMGDECYRKREEANEAFAREYDFLMDLELPSDAL